MIYELFSDTKYLIVMYSVILIFLLFVGFISLIFLISKMLKKDNSQQEEKMDERLLLYTIMTNPETKDNELLDAIDKFLAKYAILKSDEDIALFTQFYPKFVSHPLHKKKPDILKKFIAELSKKNEAIHGKDFKKKLGL